MARKTPAAQQPAATAPVVQTTENKTVTAPTEPQSETVTETEKTVAEPKTESEGNAANSETAPSEQTPAVVETPPTETVEPAVTETPAVTDAVSTAVTDAELKAMIPESFKEPESIVLATTRNVLEAYASEMAVLKPSVATVRIQQQVKLAKQLERIMATAEVTDFIKVMDLVMSYFADPAQTAFQGTAPFREFSNIPLSVESRQWFSDVLNVLVTMGPVASRGEARATFDMKVSTRHFKDDLQRERFSAYINRIAGRS